EPLSSVVITESDYYKCLRELHQGLSNSPLGNALTNNLLIIGKSLDPLDASFLYALRQTRSNRQRAKSKAWFIQCGQLTADDRIQSDKLGLTPVEIRMPRVVSGGHYYYALLLALQGLFPDLLESLAKEAMREELFAALVGTPEALAIVMASIILTGCMRKGGVNVVPSAGRHNVRFENSEEHLGGAALTPLMVAAALERPSKRPRSFALCSAIGNKNEPATQRLLRDAGTLKIAGHTIPIDLDSTSLTDEQTWHSTVIVHRGTYSKDRAKKDYDGQRIFLDRGYDKAVRLGELELVQLRKQLRAKTLKVVYFDKFLAAQHPPVSWRHEIDDKKMGPLLQKPIFGLLSKLRPNTDVIYETGATGSRFQSVEKKVAKCVNVFTCGFPLFARKVLTPKMMKQLRTSTGRLNLFRKDKYYEVDFQKETAAIDTLLGSLHQVSSTATDRVSEITCERFRTQLINQCKKWAAREKCRMRWLIVTLHHRGAIGVDLSFQKVWHCSIPESVPNLPPNVQFNTSGAGDCFRGALMHALLNLETCSAESLPHVLRFCTEAATAWCHHFRVADSLKYLHTNLGGQFAGQQASAP
ncbi:MAG: PfkB family carbohydrate kinase, partial [Planctomyces sp.]